MKEQNNKNILWSLDLAITVSECDLSKFEESELKQLAQNLTLKIDPKSEIIGIVTPFGEHKKEMKGLRLIHENQNSLITGHFVFETKKAYVNIHSCSPYKPSEAMSIVANFFNSDVFICQKIFRE